ncbi:hypothetical protein D915_007793 [Fasciola hepatica]|uniref:Uncharacterized protein n=1 Tax=Fasciola hepatica TaxID=6192 RepID=A0A4E0R4Q4_FASHE|nr:hypothetical protein D915_007793 [Fasciola hepatica]
MNPPMRKRSLSCNALGQLLLAEKEATESSSSSQKSLHEGNADLAAKVSVVGTLPVCYKKFNRKRNDVKEEGLMRASRFHRNSRSQSIPVPILLGRRGSISLPEILDGMPSGQLSSRLSLVADELEESFKQIREGNPTNTFRFSLLSLLSSRRGSTRDE